jgi:hypothetical protein
VRRHKVRRPKSAQALALRSGIMLAAADGLGTRRSRPGWALRSAVPASGGRSSWPAGWRGWWTSRGRAGRRRSPMSRPATSASSAACISSCAPRPGRPPPARLAGWLAHPPLPVGSNAVKVRGGRSPVPGSSPYIEPGGVTLVWRPIGSLGDSGYAAASRVPLEWYRSYPSVRPPWQVSAPSADVPGERLNEAEVSTQSTCTCAARALVQRPVSACGGYIPCGQAFFSSYVGT